VKEWEADLRKERFPCRQTIRPVNNGRKGKNARKRADVKIVSNISDGRRKKNCCSTKKGKDGVN